MRSVPIPSSLPGYIAGGCLPLDRHGRWKHYVEVAVYRDVKTMRAALERLCRRPPAYFHNTQAAAHSWILNTLPRHRGIVVFHRGQLGSGIVAHEMTHAADFYVRGYMKFKPNSNAGQEALASSVGTLVNAFWRWYYKNKRKISGRKK